MTNIPEHKNREDGDGAPVLERPTGHGRRWAMRFLTLLAAGSLVAAYGLLWTYNRTMRPGALDVPFRVVRIEEGATARSIAETFLSSAVDRRLFLILARTRHVDQSLKFGSYKVAGDMSLVDFVDMLAKGVPAEHVTVTIPEGYVLKQIARELDTQGIVPENEFLAVATDPAICTSLDVSGETLEGYLFPDTYFLVPETKPLNVIRTMIGRFRNVAEELNALPASLSPDELHDIVKIASIVEREALLDKEKPLIASVIYRRLDLNMRLQCDTTIRYGLDKYGRHLTYADLDSETPYNSYRYGGLPPTPICNPGRVALDSALRPADSTYVYFVARNDGTHEFSTSLSEHNIAVHKYQKMMRTR